LSHSEVYTHFNT